MAEPLDPRLLAQALMQGQVPDAQDYMMPGGNLGPSASGRANPSSSPLDYLLGAGMGGLIGGAAGGIAAAPLAVGISMGRGHAGSRAAQGALNLGTGIGGAGGAVLGAQGVAKYLPYVQTTNQAPRLGPYSPQVPQEYAGPAYDDGTMYGGKMPPRR